MRFWTRAASLLDRPTARVNTPTRVLLGFGVMLALAPAPSSANYCARDLVPAATLLFPYVAVAVDETGAPEPSGLTTITTVTNLGSEARVVHFTVWDASGDPKVDFDEILSGYDVLRIDWRDFLNGRFDIFDTSRTALTVEPPATFDPFEWGPDGRGQAGGLVPPQNRNAPGSAWPNCKPLGSNYGPPYGNRSDLAGTIQSLLQAVLVSLDRDGCTDPALLRQERLGLWEDLTRDPTFFYVTADVVADCNLYFPENSLYWSAGIVAQSNVLVGELLYVDQGAGEVQSLPAVHVEAATNQTGFGFYEERLLPGIETYREPLATAFGFTYRDDPASGISSTLTVWKNYSELAGAVIRDCGPYLYYAWDMDERSISTATDPQGFPVSGRDPNQFPLASQRVPFTATYFDLPAANGWATVVLPPSYGTWNDPYSDPVEPAYDFLMGWIAMSTRVGGAETSSEVATLANAHCFPGQVLPTLGIGVNIDPGTVCRSGDVNADGVTDTADVFYLINYLFAGGPVPL